LEQLPGPRARPLSSAADQKRSTSIGLRLRQIGYLWLGSARAGPERIRYHSGISLCSTFGSGRFGEGIALRKAPDLLASRSPYGSTPPTPGKRARHQRCPTGSGCGMNTERILRTQFRARCISPAGRHLSERQRWPQRRRRARFAGEMQFRPRTVGRGPSMDFSILPRSRAPKPGTATASKASIRRRNGRQGRRDPSIDFPILPRSHAPEQRPMPHHPPICPLAIAVDRQHRLDPSSFGTHSLRRTKATLIYRRTGNLRAVQLLLGHTKVESTVRYLGIEVDDALAIAEQIEV
jgi:Phage integrase family